MTDMYTWDSIEVDEFSCFFSPIITLQVSKNKMAEASLDDQPRNKRHFRSLFIRCLGKHDEKKHYTAVGL